MSARATQQRVTELLGFTAARGGTVSFSPLRLDSALGIPLRALPFLLVFHWYFKYKNMVALLIFSFEQVFTGGNDAASPRSEVPTVRKKIYDNAEKKKRKESVAITYNE